MQNLLIKQMKNVYGIKDLVFDSKLQEKNVLLYAPNGLMKSSFSSALSEIINGKKVDDRIYKNRVAEYNIDLFGNEYTQNKKASKIKNIIIFKHNKYDFKDINNKMEGLAISPDLKEEYNSILSLIVKDFNDLTKDIYQTIKGNSKANEKEVIAELANNLNCDSSWMSIINSLPQAFKKDKLYEKIEYFDLFNDDTIKEFNSPNTRLRLKSFLKALRSKKINLTLSGSFDYYKAKKVLETLEENNFFDDGNLIYLKKIDELVPSSRFLEIINEDEEKLINSDPDLLGKIDATLKTFDKKGTKAAFNILNNNRVLIEKLDEIEVLRKDILLAKLHFIGDKILLLKKELEKQEKQIEELKKKGINEETKWKKVTTNFNSRFHMPYKIYIEDEADSIIGKNIPQFKFEYKEKFENGEIKEVLISDLEEVLSTGELKSLAILNMLFEIESINVNDKSILILDDVVDSFDYKNKYALINFLSDIYYEYKDNMHIWILTHNFDFFHTCSLRLAYFDFNKIIAYAQNDKIIVEGFNRDESGEYLGIEIVRNWSNDIKSDNVKNIDKIVSLIPFMRNIADIKSDSTKSNYLTSLLHLKTDTRAIKFIDLKPYYLELLNVDINDTTILQKKVYDEIMNIADNKSKNIKHSNNLENKLPLAIAIRLLAEGMLKILCDKNSISYNDISGDQTYELYKLCHDAKLLNDTENETINEILVATPEFIHLNSFMYEPLIDLGIDELIRLYNKIKKVTKI